MDAQSILRRSDNATFEVVAGEAILIRLDTGSYYSMNKIGTEFWEMLDGRQTIAEHAAVIAQKYDVDPAMVTDDMIEQAEQLGAEKLVDVVG